MKKLIKNLPLVAFVFAIAAAFAFKPAEDNSNLTLYGHTGPGQWIVVTGDYTCDDNETITCVARFDNNNPYTGIMVEEVKGDFSL